MPRNLPIQRVPENPMLSSLARSRIAKERRVTRKPKRSVKYNTVVAKGIAQLDGFVESLRLLVAREEYAITDIALMFGVSRERIRQLIARHNIPVHHYPKGVQAVRVWDDAAHRFRPVGVGVIRAQKKMSSRALYARVRTGYRAHAVEALRSLYQRVNRPIGLTEAWEAVSGEHEISPVAKSKLAVIAVRGGNRPDLIVDAVKRLYADAGAVAVTVGYRANEASRKRLRSRTAARVSRAKTLRATGLTYAQIARRLKVNDGVVWAWFNHPRYANVA